MDTTTLLIIILLILVLFGGGLVWPRAVVLRISRVVELPAASDDVLLRSRWRGDLPRVLAQLCLLSVG